MKRLSCGIVGLPNVGKSTLFNALTSKGVPASNFPFCTIDPNVGVVEVYDPRIEALSKLSNSKKLVYALTEFVDIAGLVAGASKGEGLGNKFLANIRETEAIIHVVRCFDSSDITHVLGEVDPVRDVEIINLELILSDLEVASNTLSKIEKQAKGKKEMALLVEALKKVVAHLNEGKPVRTLPLTEEEKAELKIYPFLSGKKVLYLANVSEEDVLTGNKYVTALTEFVKKDGSPVLTICGKIEEELNGLAKEEKAEFMEALGWKESGLDRLIRASFDMLDLITFLTTGEIETRAWTISKGTKAPQAAGEIHTDIERGFIRAEVVAFEDMIKLGRVGAKEAGKARMEGKEYVVQDGDVVLFLHN